MSDPRELSDPLVGTVVAGRYRIDQRLAAGGMGVVYEATQQPLGRRVALKVIRGDAVHDALARARFEREAKTASSLQDPHVVVVHDFGVLDDVAGGGLYLAMEFVDGETLRDHLGSGGRLTWRRSLVVVEHVARALAAAHGKSLVHRDLKPENIMLVPTSSDGANVGAGFFCKVLDFGLAKDIDNDLLANDGKRLTRSGGFVGTPGYISPEHIDGAAEDPRQDVYALGVVWWEMLTGRHPFPAETPMKTLLRQMHEEPPALDDVLRLADGIPPAGAQLVRDMMARSPRDRPRDGMAVLAQLQGLGRAPGTDAAGLIDSNAPTLQGVRPPSTSSPPALSSVTPDLSADLRRRATGTPTVDGRRPLARTTPAVTEQPPLPSSSSHPSNPSNPSNPSHPSHPPHPSNPSHPPSPLSSSRRAAFAAGALVVGAVAIAVGVVQQQNEDPVPPPPPPIVDAGVVVVTTEIILEGLPSFSLLKAVRDLCPPHALRVYRPNRSELVTDGDVAAAVADTLQGKRVEVGGVPMMLEVRELDRGRIVVVASAFVDAGVAVEANSDAGLVGISDGGVPGDADAGVPGGIEP